MTILSEIITPTNIVTATSTTTLTNKTLTSPDLISGLTLAGAAGTNGQVLTSAGAGLPTWATPSVVAAPANPTATISGSVVNGTASTFLRSDGAPALANTTVIAASYTNASLTVDAQGRLTAASSGAAAAAPANPTATIGTAAVNGSASTFLRSDGAPAFGNLTGAVTSTGMATVLGSFTSANLATALTDETGSGANVFATSPTLVTPNLGTPTSGVLTNVTGTASGLTAGNVTTNANLTGHITSVGNAAVLGSFTSAQLATALTDETGTGANVFATSPTLVTPALGTPSSGVASNMTVDGTDAVGFRNIPQNSQSAAYTLVLADNGKHIFHPASDVNTRTYTIPANASVAYPIGTAITFINMSSQAVTIAITTDTMNLSSAGTTGSRNLAQYGSATAIKITSTGWLISGSGLT